MTAVPNSSRNGGFAAASAIVILSSAFLLFQVQPVISKVILPWFGGSPAVWTTCMLFFQVLLLGGYAYAHWLSQSPSAARQAAIHVGVLFVAILLLPILPGDHWKPADSVHPTTRILWLLTAHVGLPYFALSATGPLVQAWFGRVCAGRSPYWLYALSNFGSLAALLSYPFVFEPLMTTRAQGLLWSVSFALFGLGCGALTIRAWRNAIEQPAGNQTGSPASGAAATGAAASNSAPTGSPTSNAAASGAAASGAAIAVDTLPGPLDRLLWLFLPGLASVGLLAITNHLCQDVAVVPFMWVAPLSLYLLSFILCFGARWWYSRRLYCVLAAGSIALVCALQTHDSLAKLVETWKLEPSLRKLETLAFYSAEKLGARGLLDRIGLEGLTTNDLNECIVTHASAYLLALFSICMLCHGEMVRRRPATRHLTSFYLMTSAGGALGGIMIALVCPAMFSTYLELNLILCATYLVAMAGMAAVLIAAYRPAGRKLGVWLPIAVAWSVVAVFVVGGAVLVGRAQFEAFDTNDLATARSFYGVLHVEEENIGNPDYHGRELLNGRILHGYQFLAEHRRRIPTTYYTRRSGAGVAVETLRKIAAGDFGPNQGGLFSPDLNGFGDDDEEEGQSEDGTSEAEKPRENKVVDGDQADGDAVDGGAAGSDQAGSESDEENARNARLLAELFQQDAAMSDAPPDFEGQHPLRIAVVGLGVGTMAAYGERGDLVKFYEINPQVEQIARHHFFYLKDTPAEVQVVIGDARLSMEREAPQEYDLIVLDAFSGDAIPVHLLTLEAIGIYQRHLKPTGVIAIHVSNRHLDLVPVVGTLAKETGMYVVKVPNGQETGAMECTSDWMLVTPSAEFASHPRILSCSHTLEDRDTQGPLWTDQFSNLLQIVK